MRKIFRLSLFFSLILLVFSAVSCNSLGVPKEVFQIPDYTEKDIVENEKARIAALSEENPVMALWRASLLGDEETLTLYKENIATLFKKAFSEMR